MSKRKAESEKREFNEQWENDFLFIAGPTGKPLCIVCESTLSQNRRHDLNRHYKTQHQSEIEGKLKLMVGSELRKEYLIKKKQEIRRRQNVFVKKSSESLAMVEASYEMAFVLARKKKPFSDGEEVIKPCLQIFAKSLGDKNIEKKAQAISLSKQTITRRTEELAHDISQQLKNLVQSCTFFSLALDESTDICDVTQLGIFIRGIDDQFSVFEELLSLESLHEKTRGSDIFDKLKSCLENFQVDCSKLVSVCTDGAPSMIGRVAGTTTLLEKFVNRPLFKYHCIIHQESLCGKTLNLQHVMSPLVKCVHKIRARALNRREFREYCDVLDLEYGELVLPCEVRWLLRGQVLKRFWKLKKTVHDFLEEKNELPEERALLRDNNWLLDLAFLVDLTSHLNDLNLKLQGKNKLFPSLVDDINAFKMKLNLFVSQLKNQDFIQFPHLKEQSECDPENESNSDFTKYVEKVHLLQESFESRFRDFHREEESMMAFINPFSLSEQQIVKLPSNIQMEMIDLQATSSLKIKFNELPVVQKASDMIRFWSSLPSDNFPELRKFAQCYICRFGTTYRCEQAFSAMKLVKGKTRSRLTDSNLNNIMQLTVTELDPNFEKLARSKQPHTSHSTSK